MIDAKRQWMKVMMTMPTATVPYKTEGRFGVSTTGRKDAHCTRRPISIAAWCLGLSHSRRDWHLGQRHADLPQETWKKSPLPQRGHLWFPGLVRGALDHAMR